MVGYAQPKPWRWQCNHSARTPLFPSPSSCPYPPGRPACLHAGSDPRAPLPPSLKIASDLAASNLRHVVQLCVTTTGKMVPASSVTAKLGLGRAAITCHRHGMYLGRNPRVQRLAAPRPGDVLPILVSPREGVRLSKIDNSTRLVRYRDNDPFPSVTNYLPSLLLP